MQSFDVLSRTLNVFAPHFLEASAGTGKTFAIEHLVTRLLIEGPMPLSIEQILVVTFTRAATRELKMRIRRNLLKTQNELIAQEPSADYLHALCEKGAEAISAALKRIEGALVYYDFAQIFTLHGFCYRALKEGALEAGIGLSLSDPDKSDVHSLFAPLVKEHLCTALSLPEYSPLQMQILLKKYKSDNRQMIAALTSKMSGSHEIAPFPSFAELHASVEEKLKALEPIASEKWIEDVTRILPQYKEMTDKAIPKQIQKLGEILERKACTLEEFEELCKEELFLEGVRPDKIKVRAKLCPEESLHYPHLLERVKEILVAPLKMAKDPSVIFLRVARDLKKGLLPLIEEREQFSPDALLQKVEQALESKPFVQKMQKKYRAVIVDEFQDTDPIQWKIIQTLFLSSCETICLVGDPKQSIYSFRNADVYTYLDAAAQLGEEAKKYLDTNFRSHESLVKALNLLFSKAQGGWMPLPFLEKMLDVPPVKYKPTPDAGQEAALHFFVASAPMGRSLTFPHKEMEEKKIFPYIASQIQQMQQELHEIAILVKDRYQAKRVIDHLKKWQIPSHFKRGSAIADSPAFFAVKLLLKAALSPGDTSKLKAMLGSELICWSETQLIGSATEPALLDAKMQMHHLHHELITRGYGSFFQQWLQSSFEKGGKTVLEKILERGAVALYTDLRRLAELLIEEELTSQLSAAQLLQFLEEIEWESSQEDGRLRSMSQEEKGSVVVMTTHLSKGLEFDTVFALGLICRQRSFPEAVIKSDGKSVLTLFNAEDPHCKRARAELDAEKLRQLYVCLTRAKSRLYVPLAIDEDQKPIPEGHASPLELFFSYFSNTPLMDLATAETHLTSLAPLISYSIVEEKLPPEQTFPSIPITLPIPPAPALVRTEGKMYSFSALAQAHPFTPKGNENTPPLENSPHALPLGSGTGLILHKIFETLFKTGIHHSRDDKQLSNLVDREIGMTELEPYRPIFLPWLKKILAHPLIGFSLSEIVQLQQELEFYFPLNGSLKGVMKGFADLVFAHNGKYYLLDWKSNYLGPTDADYAEENLVQAMHAHDYFLQASIYKEALARYVKLFDNRPFEEIFGGAIYYFIRGNAPLIFNPEAMR